MTRPRTVLLALVLVLSLGSLVSAGFSLEKVRGGLDATDEDSRAYGKFKLIVADVAGSSRERVKVYARRLDRETTYEVRIGEDLDDSVSFGEMRVSRRGRGKLTWKSHRHDYPDGVDSLKDLSGMTLMIIADDEVVLEGDIPEFASLGDTPDEGAIAFGAGTERLEATADAADHSGGRISASAVALPDGTHEFLWVTAWLLDSDEEYTVTAVDSDENSTKLGTLEPRGRFGIASLVLDTFRAEEMPAHVWTLGGRTVEVRDSTGTLILSGTFPDLK